MRDDLYHTVFDYLCLHMSVCGRLSSTAMTTFTTVSSCFITPQWKVLRSSNLCHSAPFEMLFHMVSFFDEVKFFRFWPKTMDYNKAFLPKSR